MKVSDLTEALKVSKQFKMTVRNGRHSRERLLSAQQLQALHANFMSPAAKRRAERLDPGMEFEFHMVDETGKTVVTLERVK